MKRFWSLLLIMAFLNLSAQDKKWSAEVYYPLSIGEAFGSSNQGIIGTSLSYRFSELGKAHLGGSVDATWFGTTFIEDSDPIQESDFRDFFLQAKAFYDTPVTDDEKLRFLGGLGWAYQRARSPGFITDEGEVKGNEANTGPLLSAGLAYTIFRRWFLAAKTDFLFLFGDSVSRTVGILKIGIGFRF